MHPRVLRVVRASFGFVRYVVRFSLRAFRCWRRSLQNMRQFHVASSSSHARIRGFKQHPCHSRGFWLQAVSPDAGHTHYWQTGALTLQASEPLPPSNAAKRQEHARALHRVNICVDWVSAARTYGQAYHHSRGSNQSTVDSDQGLVDEGFLHVPRSPASQAKLSLQVPQAGQVLRRRAVHMISKALHLHRLHRMSIAMKKGKQISVMLFKG